MVSRYLLIPLFLALALPPIIILLTNTRKSYGKIKTSDYEIFDLMSQAREMSGNAKATLYSYMELAEDVAKEDIQKAFKTLSMQMHPDKNPNDALAEGKFAALGKIAKVLRDKKRRARYDMWRKEGVPWYVGRKYFYRKSENMGIIETSLWLILFASAAQYAVMYAMYAKDRAALRKIKLHEETTRAAAGTSRRAGRVSVPLPEPHVSDAFTSPSEGLMKRIQTEGLENVELDAPSLRSVIICRIPLWAMSKFRGMQNSAEKAVPAKMSPSRKKAE